MTPELMALVGERYEAQTKEEQIDTLTETIKERVDAGDYAALDVLFDEFRRLRSGHIAKHSS